MALPEFSQTLAELQGLGFFPDMERQALGQRFTEIWGPWPADATVEQELMLASLDLERVWQGDLKIYEDPAHHYLETLQGWQHISRGVWDFQDFRWGSGLSFACEGDTFLFSPRPGHYLDMALLEVVNAALNGLQRFEVSDQLGMPNFVVLLDSNRKQALQQRGWRFLPPSQGRHGFVSDFWEQGMEEAPWHIFQDRRYCASRQGGWSREGMEELAEGSHLTLFRPDGTVLWSGTLRGRRKGWFGWLPAAASDWHPPELDAATWDSYFRQSPPLRAHYLPATNGVIEPLDR